MLVFGGVGFQLFEREPLPATDLKASLKATCFVGNLSLNKAAYRGGDTVYQTA
jgi:hypothetical protein